MKLKTAFLCLFVLFALSLFFNLKYYFVDSSRDSGVISELNKAQEFDYRYINANAETMKKLYSYCENQKDINVATLKGEDSRLPNLLKEMEQRVTEYVSAASESAKIKAERQQFISELKYASTVKFAD